MNLRQLEMVVAVVDHGGFTRAAESLHIAQPSLSQAVRALERELGTELFHRTGRTVTLTSAGEALLGPARATLRDVAAARAAVRDVVGLAGGRLDLVCLPTLAVTPTAGLVGRFRTEHPAVTVRLAEPEQIGAAADMVRTGAAELAITDLPAQPLAGLDTVELAAQEYLAVLPPVPGRSHPSRARPLDVEALATLPLIATPPGTSTRRAIDDALGEAGLVADIAVETEHREMLVALVLEGAGVSILPGPMARDAAERGALLRSLRPRLTRRVGLVRRPGPLSPAAAAFVELAMGADPGDGRS